VVGVGEWWPAVDFNCRQFHGVKRGKGSRRGGCLTKGSGQHAFSNTRARWGVTDDGTRRGDTNRGQQ
jgi:hypothetical protein